ncbi:uncharacterized protein LOC133194528 isoform X1 [Saccostrea echinata]|uniref:uncharacterized protein LOC133194528 isoform X1 n=1 Tax=Saccostrea echinata TaxID=191078 RepID=UPI002A7F3478|nr:uncharacterized protein LOC133194528 isoform X1 [Saccostrea echinata]
MGIDTQAKRLLSILTFLFLMFLNPVQCARGSYCYYYYSVNGYKFYYCVYYYYNKSSTSSSSTGTITGAVIGGIVGFVILVAIVVIVCVKVCKKSKHGNVIVRTMQPTVPYISSSTGIQHLKTHMMDTQPTSLLPTLYSRHPIKDPRDPRLMRHQFLVMVIRHHTMDSNLCVTQSTNLQTRFLKERLSQDI